MVHPMPCAEVIHLKPAAELAERVLLPGDPHRALAVAQAVLDSPRMFNHQRGLWGYTGGAPDGRPLTVQSTGMGGPSAAVVVEELLDLGARTLVRIGTCGALVPDLRLEELLAVTAAVPSDGTSAALGASAPVRSDLRLFEALLAAAESRGGARPAMVASSDLFYDDRPGVVDRWLAAGAIAVEMEAATVLRLAERRGAAAACLLVVTDLLARTESRDGHVRIEREGLEAAGVQLGQVAAAALAGS